MRFHTWCSIFIIVVCSGCSQTFSQISNEYGFQRLQTPHKILKPGTLIAFEESGDGRITIIPVCWKNQAFPQLLTPQAAPEAATNVKRHLENWIELEPEYLGTLQAKFPEIQDIQLRLENASVAQYSDTELYEALSTRSPSCQDAVATREANGETVHTVLKVLTADATYKVIGIERSRMAGRLPQELLERLKTEFGASSVSTFNQTLKGSRLPMAFQSDIIGLEDEERQPIIQKVAILNRNTSDADRLQKQ